MITRFIPQISIYLQGGFTDCTLCVQMETMFYSQSSHMTSQVSAAAIRCTQVILKDTFQTTHCSHGCHMNTVLTAGQTGRKHHTPDPITTNPWRQPWETKGPQCTHATAKVACKETHQSVVACPDGLFIRQQTIPSIGADILCNAFLTCPQQSEHTAVVCYQSTLSNLPGLQLRCRPLSAPGIPQWHHVPQRLLNAGASFHPENQTTDLLPVVGQLQRP